MTNKNETLVKYTLPIENETIFSKEFRLTIPSKKKLIELVEKEKCEIDIYRG